MRKNEHCERYNIRIFDSRAQRERNDLIIPNGRYILSGCPSGGGTSTYNMMAQRTYNGNVDLLGRDSGDGVLFVANGDDFSANELSIQINIFIKSGQTVSNLIFKPMLRYAEDTNNTYVPYVPTNRELVSWRANNKLGAKNLLRYPYADITKTVNGITFTDNGDGTISDGTDKNGDGIISANEINEMITAYSGWYNIESSNKQTGVTQNGKKANGQNVSVFNVGYDEYDKKWDTSLVVKGDVKVVPEIVGGNSGLGYSVMQGDKILKNYTDYKNVGHSSDGSIRPTKDLDLGIDLEITLTVKDFLLKQIPSLYYFVILPLFAFFELPGEDIR